jgi:hypothetical protein
MWAAGHPRSLNLRTRRWDVGDQANSGSCVGWASTDEVAWYTFVTANRLRQATKLSPRFTWMACKETDHRPRRCPPETSDQIV